MDLTLLAKMDTDTDLLKAIDQLREVHQGIKGDPAGKLFSRDLARLFQQHGYLVSHEDFPRFDRECRETGALEGRMVMGAAEGVVILPKVLLMQLLEKIAEDEGFQEDWRDKSLDYLLDRAK